MKPGQITNLQHKVAQAQPHAPLPVSEAEYAAPAHFLVQDSRQSPAFSTASPAFAKYTLSWIKPILTLDRFNPILSHHVSAPLAAGAED